MGGSKLPSQFGGNKCENNVRELLPEFYSGLEIFMLAKMVLFRASSVKCKWKDFEWGGWVGATGWTWNRHWQLWSLSAEEVTTDNAREISEGVRSTQQWKHEEVNYMQFSWGRDGKLNSCAIGTDTHHMQCSLGWLLATLNTKVTQNYLTVHTIVIKG